MSNLIQITRAMVVVSVMFAGAIPCVSARSIPLIYEAGPNVGLPFTAGPLSFKLSAFDAGTVYPDQPVLTTIGYTGVPTPPADMSPLSVYSGIEDLDAIPGKTPALGGLLTGEYDVVTGDGRLEDTWGVGRVDSIKDADGFNVWTPAIKGQEITVMFYGLQDFYLQQVNAITQFIDGVGLRADFYLDTTPDFDPTLGTGGRTGLTTYTTATDGTLVLKAESVPGFINSAGTFGGLATEFESQFQFNGGSSLGQGSAFLELIDNGTADYARFNTDAFVSLVPATYANTDLRVTWDITPNLGSTDWLVLADDPISAVAIPEPSSCVLLCLGVAAFMVRGYRTRKSAFNLQ